METKHRQWLEKDRKLDIELLTINLGVDTIRGRIGFPIHTADGDLVGYKKLRHDYDKETDGSKWITETIIEDTPGMFNGEVYADIAAASKGEQLVITEGEIDCITSIMAGYQHSVSLAHGAQTSVNAKCLEAFRHKEALDAWPWVILAVDDDEKGREYRDVLVSLFGKARCKTVKYPKGCKDLNDVLIKHDIETVRSVLASAKPWPIADVYRYNDYPSPPNHKYYRNNIQGFEDKFCPFKGSLVTVTGIAGHGKSTFVNALLGDWIKRYSLKICMASLEMSVKPFLGEALCRLHRGHRLKVKTVSDLHKHGLSSVHLPKMVGQELMLAEDWIQDNFLFIDMAQADHGAIPTLDGLLERATLADQRYGLDVLVIDPFNKLNINVTGNAYQDEQEALNKIKAWAVTHRKIVIVCAHPNKNVADPRTGETRAPMMHDISGGQAWGAMSDLVASVFRPDLSKNGVEVRVLKAKFWDSGRIGTTGLVYARGIENFLPVSGEGVEDIHGSDPRSLDEDTPEASSMFDGPGPIPPDASMH